MLSNINEENENNLLEEELFNSLANNPIFNVDNSQCCSNDEIMTTDSFFNFLELPIIKDAREANKINSSLENKAESSNNSQTGE